MNTKLFALIATAVYVPLVGICVGIWVLVLQNAELLRLLKEVICSSTTV